MRAAEALRSVAAERAVRIAFAREYAQQELARFIRFRLACSALRVAHERALIVEASHAKTAPVLEGHVTERTHSAGEVEDSSGCLGGSLERANCGPKTTPKLAPHLCFEAIAQLVTASVP